MDPHLPLFHVQTMKTVRDQRFFPYRIATMLVGFAGGLTLLVATLGLYAVMSQHVAQRTREIGIRIALGATRVNVIRTVLKQGFALFLMGFLLGTAMALVISRALTSLLFGIGPTDPVSFLAAAGTLGVTAALAGYWPASRAAKVDPMEALRCE
jgi:putative ABC transport system permease protein